jgi:hypothetical protein
VPPIAPISPSTCQGSSACRISSFTPSNETSPQNGEAELELRLEPFRPDLEAVAAEIGDHVEEVLPDEMRQHEAIVQRGAPAGQPAAHRRLPQPRDDGADQHLLGKAHAGMWGHLEAAELDQPEPSGRTVRRIELVDADFCAVRIPRYVDEQVAQQPVDKPRQRSRSLSRVGNLRQRDLQLVEPVMARLVDARRLARGADEEAGEEVGKRRVALPVGDELRSRSGLRRKGLSIGIAPPTTTWLPPPVPTCLPSIMNLSAPSRQSRASS